MNYENILPATFLSRPNRFVAHILVQGQETLCHVKNTGRCRELLLPGCDILVQRSEKPGRKTPYDLISVYKGGRLINMDAAAPNTVFGEFLAAGGLGFVPEQIRPEYTYGDSRFDFYFEHGSRRAFAEVKGVTLEQDGIVRFPDAPTLRGVKHLRGLIDCVAQGLEAYVVFVIQMKGVRFFAPNWSTHPEFGHMLRQAQKAGVKILAYDCRTTPNTLSLDCPVTVQLEESDHSLSPGGTYA